MRRQFLALSLAVVILIAVQEAGAQAPYRDAPTQPTTTEHLRQPVMDVDGGGFDGLLDPTRFTMGHQIGFGYTTLGDRGVSQGYYMNTLTYRFDAPVMLRLRTGITNNPFANSGSFSQPGQSALTGMFNNAEFFGGADLFWKPTENSSVMISVNRLAPGMGYGYGHGYGYGMPGRYGYDRYGFGSPFRSPFGYDDPWGPYNN